jgi:peptidoglycan/xylan/chitin deacetylase (PgdA/CDA1 family)
MNTPIYRSLYACLALGLASCSDTVTPIVPTATTLTLQSNSVSFSALGQTEQLSVTVLDQEGKQMNGAALTWMSLAESVVTVSDAGLLTAVGNGVATVTVTSGSASAELTATVQQVAAALMLSADSASLAVLGDTLRLTATVEDSGGSTIVAAVVTWTALDSLVATVSADGLVTAIGNGTTAIAAISGAALATATIAVAQIADSIALSADSVAFDALSDTLRLTATVTDSGGAVFGDAPVIWTSSDTTVARVSTAGLVTSVDNGTAIITALSDQAARTAQVVVQQAPASIVLQPDSVVLSQPGETAALAATVFDRLGFAITAPSLTWTSADDAIATVDSTGQVTAVAGGTVLISVQAGTNTAQVSARVEPDLTLVAAGPTAVSGEVATELALSVRVEDLLGAGYQGSTVTWSVGVGSGSISSPAETVSDETGHAGAVWQLGTAAGPQQASASIESWGNVVTVDFTATALPGPPVTANLIADSILLSANGETAFLAPTFQDTYGNPTGGAGLIFESRDPGVAMVAPDGLVTGVAEGSTYVTMSFASPSDSILVTVIMRGAITVTFDDGFVTMYDNAWPVFQEFALVGNIGVNPARVGGPGDFPAYMTKANLDELDAAGWSMVSHGMTHDSLTTQTVGELDWQLRASQQWIDDQAYQGSNVFIVPYHDWGARERNAIGVYYEAARGTSAGIVSPDSLVPWRPSNPYDLTGIEADSLPYTTVAGRDRLRALLQRTADEGAFLDVFFHHLPPANVDALRATLAVLDEFRERVLPYHELYPRFARSVY